MILEDSLKYHKEALGEAATTPEAKPTTKDVFKDPKSENRFGKMLTREAANGDADAQLVAKAMLSPKDAKPGDLEKVEAMRLKFGERMNASEAISGEVTLDTIDDFLGIHPDLQRVMNQVGKQGAVDMIKKWLPEVAVDDPVRFEAIHRQYKDIIDFRDKNPAKANFEKVCKDNGLELDMSEFARVMQNPDAKERKRELRNMVREQMGVFRKALGVVTLGVWSPVRDATTDFNKMKKTIEDGKLELWKKKNELGKSLGLMFDENDEVREALFLEMQGQKAEPQQVMNLKETRTRVTSEADALKQWEDFKKTPEYTALPDATAKGKVLDDWKNKRMERAEGKDKGGGIWGEIALIIMRALFGKAKFNL